jgi:hypothetical protein
MKLMGHVARIEIGEVHTEFWWRDLRERHHVEDLGINENIILKWILKKWNEEAWIGLVWLRIRTFSRLL